MDQREKLWLSSAAERDQVNRTIIDKYNRMVKEGSVYTQSKKKYPNPLMGMLNVQSDFDQYINNHISQDEF